MILKNISIVIFLTIFIQNCATFNSKKDYGLSTGHLRAGRIGRAISDLPNNEKGSFISIMEQAYLHLLAGKPRIDQLIRIAKKIKKRVRFSVSRELKTFFYLKTPGGYYASEHELVWLHLLLSWGYSIRGDYEKAYVEAKQSSILLSSHWSKEGRFDDAFLRVMLAALWAKCGHWNDAQVDFRVAANIDPSLKWARKLSNMKNPPADLIIILGGVGPEPLWNPHLGINPFRGFRGISFEGRGSKSKLYAVGSKNFKLKLNLTPDSASWYRRHFIRDNTIHDLVKDSRYGQKVVTSMIKAATVSVFGVVAGTAVAAGGIAFGGAIVYFSLKVNSEEGAGLGLFVMAGGVGLGYKIAKNAVTYSIKKSKRELDISNTYRFVRFFPEYAWVGWGKKALPFPLIIYRRKEKVLTLTKRAPKFANSSNVYIGFFPDAD